MLTSLIRGCGGFMWDVGPVMVAGLVPRYPWKLAMWSLFGNVLIYLLFFVQQLQLISAYLVSPDTFAYFQLDIEQ